MRLTPIVLALAIAAACEGGRAVSGRGGGGGSAGGDSGGSGVGGGGGNSAPLCRSGAGENAALALDIEPFPAVLPGDFSGEVLVVEHERTTPTTGRLVFEDEAGGHTTLRYTVPSHEVAPAVDAGARVELAYSVNLWAFQLAQGVVLRVDGNPAWLASIDVRLDLLPIGIRAACDVPRNAECATGALQWFGVDALVSAGGSELPASAGEVVELPGGGAFVLAWWWDTCGCCSDPPSSIAWVHAARLSAP